MPSEKKNIHELTNAVIVEVELIALALHVTNSFRYEAA